MTYFGFHLRFVLPPLAAACVWAAPWAWPVEKWAVLGAILAIVMAFTAPWDNYAVAKGIWDFDPKRIWRRVGWLPVEEYLFFWLQSLLVVFVLDGLAGVRGGAQTLPADPWIGHALAGTLCAITVGVFVTWRRGFGPGTPGHYAWHLLFWFVPVILLQWAVGWNVLLPRLDLLLAVVFAVGTWLTFADYRAIAAGIWFFDAKQITGWKLRGVMPWEEIAFFYLTSLLVAQSWLVLLPDTLR